MSTYKSIMSHEPAWLCAPDDENDIVLGSIARLVRNLPGEPFPGWSNSEQRARVAEQILPHIQGLKGMKTAWTAELNSLSYEQRMSLLVRKMISPCMAARQDGCHIVLPNKQNLLFMVNEEEHLVIHAYDAGADFKRIFKTLRPVIHELENNILFAHSRRHGYLTSIPTETGSGLQLYAILHLPALTISNMMTQVQKGLEQLRLCLSPGFSDGEDDTGNCYILFSQPSACEWETMAEFFYDIIRQLEDREWHARQKLIQAPGKYLADAISRAFGTVRCAMRISLRELRNVLSLLRLGATLGIIQQEGTDTKTFLSHLHKLHLKVATLTARTDANDEMLSVKRAELVRKTLQNITFTYPGNP